MNLAPEKISEPVGGHRRLLVGSLVVRRVSYRSVARVALPLFSVVYVVGVGLAALVWNLAAVAGWSPDDDGLSGVTVFWWAVTAGLVAVPLATMAAVAMGALYNEVSERVGGIEIAVVSPRSQRRRTRNR